MKHLHVVALIFLFIVEVIETLPAFDGVRVDSMVNSMSDGFYEFS